MITAGQAVQSASNYFRTLTAYPANPVLEEIEMVKEGANHFWLVTLSYNPSNTIGISGIYPGLKEYKQFKVTAKDGGVLSMKIRKI